MAIAVGTLAGCGSEESGSKAACSGDCCGNACGNPGPVDLKGWLSELPALKNGKPWMPGVPGGIPVGTPDMQLTAGQMTTGSINAAIAAASERGSPDDIRVVQMPAGTFDGLGEIEARNYVILRGSGADGGSRTRLNFTDDGGVRSAQPDWSAAPLTDLAIGVGSTLPIGSDKIPVGNASGFDVGDLIQIDQLDDLSYVSILDAGFHKRAPFTDGPYNGPLSPDGFRSVSSIYEVTAVDGSTLTIDPPTRIAYTYHSQAGGTTRLHPEVWRLSRRGNDGLWYFGLENVSIAGPQNGAVNYNGGAFNWIKDVETDGQDDGGISGNHVTFSHQFRSEVRRVYAHHTTGGPWSGGANYGINLDDATSESLVIDSIVMFMNKVVQTNASGAGNVIAYNYVDNSSANGGDWMDGVLNGSHQSFSHNLLVEGNWAANIGCDTTHGNSGFMAFLRNYSQGYSSDYDNGGNRRAANSDGWQREMAFLGNVLNAADGAKYEITGQEDGPTVWSIGQFVWGDGEQSDVQSDRPPANDMTYDGRSWDTRQPTFTSKAKDKLWRHGNWDAVNQDIADWDPEFPNHAIPASLFLDNAPSFFGRNVWPWIDPTGESDGDRVKVLPAKARFDGGSPFAQ